MHFDLFYELSRPAPSQDSEQSVFRQVLDQMQLADQLEFRTAWLVEHHFMPGYSHSAAPDLFLAAASQLTKKLRLGLAILPLPYHHPVLAAERIATLDILSNARLELGIGRGFSPLEYKTFAADMADSRAHMLESLQVIQKCAQPGPLTHRGRFFNFAEIEVIPKPLQQPPPMWMAAVSPESYTIAAQNGAGVLAGPFKPWFMIKEDFRRYHDAAAGNAQAFFHPPRTAMTVGVVCLENKRDARRMGKESMLWFYRQLFDKTRPVLRSLLASYEYYRTIGRFAPLFEATLSLPVLEKLGMVIVGDPEHCRQQFLKLKQAGVDHVLCAIGAGALTHEVTCESMQLLAEEVIPYVEKT